MSVKKDKKLHEMVLDWWEDAQYWSNGDRNVFDDEPDFVVKAKELSDLIKDSEQLTYRIYEQINNMTKGAQ